MTDPKHCPKCGNALEEKSGMFHWRGMSFPGLVCHSCKALWASGDGHEKFMNAVVASAKDMSA